MYQGKFEGVKALLLEEREIYIPPHTSRPFTVLFDKLPERGTIYIEIITKVTTSGVEKETISIPFNIHMVEG